MVPRTAYPPTFHHPKRTLHLPPTSAQSALADFLTLTERNAHLHPDAQLSASGITFAAQSGPKGGLALHHLRRIEAGLRGERLGAETTEELELEFGGPVLPAGDDSKVDRLIEGGVTERKGGLKRKRTSEWAETSSQPDAMLPPESRDASPGDAAAGATEGWQSKDDYELSQRDIAGDVADRSGAPLVRQNGAPPAIRHVTGGGGGSGGGGSGGGKDAKRAAKRERKKGEKVERAERRAMG